MYHEDNAYYKQVDTFGFNWSLVFEQWSTEQVNLWSFGASTFTLRCFRPCLHEPGWRDHIAWMALEHLGVTLEELESFASERKEDLLLVLVKWMSIHVFSYQIRQRCWSTCNGKNE